MNEILTQWNISFARVAAEYAIPGSPERCIERTVIEDVNGKLWMLERLAASQARRREEIARMLSGLELAGVPAVAAPAALEGTARNPEHQAFIARIKGAAWQLTPFILGTELPRPDYIADGWRGHAVASFINLLQQARSVTNGVMQAPTPPLDRYIASLMHVIESRRPHVYARLKPLAGATQVAATTTHREALAHGDLHPINIIWGQAPTPDEPCEKGLAGIIDWEFCGVKDVLYDAANCIGCAGFEHPSALEKDFVLALTADLLRDGVLTAQEVKALPLRIAALRFAWVSEWLRRNDDEMLEMEIEYIHILLQQTDRLAMLWSSQ
ncbi:phosphotransferase [Oleidesulfovibrio sp.]|uniref:phosphotransferase n=1 Tax=Oleidesulfovibrio sp. TaxID=2909707 RepID=UPI003A843226